LVLEGLLDDVGNALRALAEEVLCFGEHFVLLVSRLLLRRVLVLRRDDQRHHHQHRKNYKRSANEIGHAISPVIPASDNHDFRRLNASLTFTKGRAGARPHPRAPAWRRAAGPPSRRPARLPGESTRARAR